MEEMEKEIEEVEEIPDYNCPHFTEEEQETILNCKIKAYEIMEYWEMQVSKNDIPENKRIYRIWKRINNDFRNILEEMQDLSE